MKNILLMLLLANILYLMWGLFTEEDSQPGVAFINETDLGPSLEVTTGREGDSYASIGAVLGSGEPAALEAVVGRSCVTVGPFRESMDADSALLEYSNEGMKTALRGGKAQIFVGHWVWIQNIADEARARDILAQLKEGGLADAYPDRSDAENLKISLGLFGDADGAEKIELQAQSLGFAAEVIPSKREKDVYFVDIGLLPGRGAGAIVEKYGEDRVLLRDAATCPH